MKLKALFLFLGLQCPGLPEGAKPEQQPTRRGSASSPGLCAQPDLLPPGEQPAPRVCLFTEATVNVYLLLHQTAF